MKLSEAINVFIIYSQAGGRAACTVVWYREKLSRVVAYLHDPEITGIASDDLNRFIAELRMISLKGSNNPRLKPVQSPLSVNTIHGYVRAIRRLFNWLVQDGRLLPDQNPARRLSRPKLPKLPPKEISPSDFRALLDATALSGRWAKRDRAILLFLMDTGCRTGGLVGLRRADLDLENGRARLIEKGAKARYVFFSTMTKDALREYLADRSDNLDLAFVGRFGALSTFAIGHITRRLKKRSGPRGRVNPHSFRHAFAKQYLENGGDLGSLSDLMGHSDVMVTKNSYSIFLTGELQRKHDSHSPLGAMLADGQRTT